MPLHVLQVITDPARHGAQLFAVDLGDALREADIEVRTVALAESATTPTLDVPTLGRPRLAGPTHSALRRELVHADVAIAHGGPTLPACALATLATSTPFVYRQTGDSRFRASTPARRVRARAALSRAEHVVALWQGAADTLHRDFGVRADRITVIPNGVVTDRFVPADATRRAEARRALSLDEQRFTVVYAGALVPEKGVDLAIEAMAKCERAQLLVVGAGPEEATLRALAARAAPERVAFVAPSTGPLSAYEAGDAIVLASRGDDIMPSVLIEAALMQLPAIATTVGAIPEIVLEGATGELVPVGDVDALARAIGSYCADPDRAHALGLAARAHCLEHFSMGPIATAWTGLLRAVTGGSDLERRSRF